MKKQTAISYALWAQDRRHAVNQICQHNMQEGTIKLHLTGDTIYHQSSNGYTPVSIHYDSSMEMNALKAINMFASTKPNSLYPSLMQMYTVRRADERVMLQNPENLNWEVFLTQDLKKKLLKYKRESVDKYEKDPYWPSDQNYYNIVNKEYAEIQWLKMFSGTQNDFFNSEYIKGFGLVFQNNPNPGQNQEEEAMLQELMKQLELMKLQQQEILLKQQEKDRALEKIAQERDAAIELMTAKDQELIKKNEALADKDRALADKDQIIEEKNNIISEQESKNLELTTKLEQKSAVNEDLILKLQASEAKLVPLQEKITDLKSENKELKDEKIELRAEKKVLFDEKKIALEEKKLLVEEKKYYFDLSIEQASQIVSLEQIHCNNPKHFEIISSGESSHHE